MRYAVHRFVLPAEREGALAERLAALGFHAFSLATRPDGRLDGELYGRDGVLPPPVLDAVAELAGGRAPPALVEGDDLLAGLGDDEPRELAPGVWIDPAGDLRRDGDLVLRLPPGPAFGDGRHPSTRLAAALMQGIGWRGRRVLDLGCGTGVLGLLAAKRGARAVDFADRDGDAIGSCRRACAANGVAPGALLHGDLLAAVPDDRPYDAILANLYADLLHAVLDDPRLDALLPHGELVCSGVSHRRVEEVRAHLARRGFEIREERPEAWWWGCSAGRSRRASAAPMSGHAFRKARR